MRPLKRRIDRYITKKIEYAVDRHIIRSMPNSQLAAEHLSAELMRRATGRTADFVTMNMPDAVFCESRNANLEFALPHRVPGLVLEFGVFRGKTITLIANACNPQPVYGFDSFEGLPETWNTVNMFDSLKGKLPEVPANAKLIKGWFNDTLPGFLAEHNDPVGFAHIDCDIYSSTAYVLSSLKDRLAPGAVIVFDEFFNYHEYERHEFKAFNEFIAATGRKYQFISFAGHQVTVKMD